MSENLRGRSFLKLQDFTAHEVGHLLALSADLKRSIADAAHGLLVRGDGSQKIRCGAAVAAGRCALGTRPHPPGVCHPRVGCRRDLECRHRLGGRRQREHEA